MRRVKYLWIGAAVAVVVILIGVFALVNRPDPAPREPPALGNASADRLDEEEALLVLATLTSALGNALANSPDPSPDAPPALGDATISLEVSEGVESFHNEAHGGTTVDVWIGGQHRRLCMGLTCDGFSDFDFENLPEGTVDYRIEGTRTSDGWDADRNEEYIEKETVRGSGTIEVWDGMSFLIGFEDGEGHVEMAIVPTPYRWDFLPPLDSPYVAYPMKAGGTVPIRFSLGGYRGLDILAPEYPRSYREDCPKSPEQIEEVPIEKLFSGSPSGLEYDAGHYTYYWKTDAAWSGSCRDLRFVLKGQEGEARWHFLFE